MIKDQYAVIGNPIEHSLSPKIHSAFAKQTNQALTYERILAPFDAFSQTVTQFIERGGLGLNVTLPFKQQAFELATKKSQDAIDAQAVNTLVFHEDGVVEGCNTDGMGLIQDLTHNHHYCLRQKRILIIGAGGAVRGILAPLLAQAPSSITIANRTKSTAQRLADHFELSGGVEALSLDELDCGPFDLVINAVSVAASHELTLPDGLIGKHTWCYDLNYTRDHHTPFTLYAKEQNAEKVLDGFGMLVEQAAASFYIWRGVYPDTSEALQFSFGNLEIRYSG